MIKGDKLKDKDEEFKGSGRRDRYDDDNNDEDNECKKRKTTEDRDGRRQPRKDDENGAATAVASATAAATKVATAAPTARSTALRTTKMVQPYGGNTASIQRKTPHRDERLGRSSRPSSLAERQRNLRTA